MNFDFFLKVNQFRVSVGQYASAEDFTDVLNYMLTPMILIFFAGISASKQYLFTPIQCWAIMETGSSHRMEYIENLCWIENMYYWPVTDTLPKGNKLQRDDKKIYYYQWVPFVLALQAACFYLPRIFWLFLGDRFGTSIMDIIRFAMSAATVDQDKRQRMVQYLAAHIEKLLFYAQPYRHGRWNQVKTRCAQLLPCFVLTKRTGFVLVGSYLLIKLLYIKNAILQLVIMQEFLGMNGTLWGLQLLANQLTRRDWVQTGIFPRVTRCDVWIDFVGQHNAYTLQCVLPNNMLNEKMYVFLWFWTLATMALTVFSFLSWSIGSTMRSYRRTFIKKYLKMMTPIQPDEKALAKRFVNNFLRYDGIFILKMVRYNAGDLITAEIVREIWHRFRAKKLDQPQHLLLPLMDTELHQHCLHPQQQQQQQHQAPERPPRKMCNTHQQQQQQQHRRHGSGISHIETTAPGDDSASYV